MSDCFVDFSALLTSHEEIFLGKPEDFKAFHNSFGLPVHSFIFKIFFLIENELMHLTSSRIIQFLIDMQSRSFKNFQ